MKQYKNNLNGPYSSYVYLIFVTPDIIASISLVKYLVDTKVKTQND